MEETNSLKGVLVSPKHKAHENGGARKKTSFRNKDLISVSKFPVSSSKKYAVHQAERAPMVMLGIEVIPILLYSNCLSHVSPIYA